MDQAEDNLSPDLLFIILGPTASGKTKLAVELANAIQGEIISADSRQVYRQMDVGTGKDLQEYGNIPYHLIDIANPGEQYNVDRFRNDFFATYDGLVSRGTRPILCGGSGSYIQTILRNAPYSQIPKDAVLQDQLAKFSQQQLIQKIQQYTLPSDFEIDYHSHKRLVRALEILLYLEQNQPEIKPQRTVQNFIIFGLNPDPALRRKRITERLQQRMNNGLIEEVKHLIDSGTSADSFMRYGLEYKYVTMHLQGELDREKLFQKLNTEIHRYAKRQMTYFRKMEKDGIPIHWI